MSSSFSSDSNPDLVYPTSNTVDVADTYHGTTVPDPYRWLEDENSTETREWVAAQNGVTRDYLKGLPGSDVFRRRLGELWNYERKYVPKEVNGIYFFMGNAGLRNQPVLYRTRSFDEEPVPVLDPNEFSDDGTVALTNMEISSDAGLIAYAVSEAGSDWMSIRLRDIESGRDLEDRIDWVKFSSVNLTHDGKGLFYSRFPADDSDRKYSRAHRNHGLYYHRIGTPQEEDKLIHSLPDRPAALMLGGLSDDGRFLFLMMIESAGGSNALGYIDLGDPSHPNIDAPLVMLSDSFAHTYRPIGSIGSTIYVGTDDGSPKSRVVAFDIESDEPGTWRTVIPEEDDVLERCLIVGGHLCLEYLHNASHTMRLHRTDGSFVRDVPLPEMSSVLDATGREESSQLFYMTTSFFSPTTVYRYDIETGRQDAIFVPKLLFNPDEFEAHQLWFESADGTSVPMFVTHRKGIKLDGSNPTILYGYGGYGVSLTPGFSPNTIAWMEEGGVYATVNLRGGGEFGEDWHRAGMRDRKQNVFNDFIAAAENLFERGYTSPERLAIRGGSNGGLLVGAVMTQRPELAAVALPSVAVMDMLRYHTFTIGSAWAEEYGTSDDPEMFPTLYGYSPLHNLRPGTNYPATLVMTGDHDDRVVPAHSYKFTAQLQKCQAGNPPVLIRIETRGGHGTGKPLSMFIESGADELAFAAHHLGITDMPTGEDQ